MWMLLPKNVETITVWIIAVLWHKVDNHDRCTVKPSPRLKDLFMKIAANHIWSLNCLLLKFHQNTGRDQNNLIIGRKTTWQLFTSMNRLLWLVVWHLYEEKVTTNHSQHNDFDWSFWLSISMLTAENYASNTAPPSLRDAQCALSLDQVGLSGRPGHILNSIHNSKMTCAL